MRQSDRAIKKADAALLEECRRQVYLVYGAAAVALHSRWRYGKAKVEEILNAVDEVWREVGADSNMSMLQMLEAETGIEIKLTDSSKSWHDLVYLNGAMSGYEQITKAQYVYMRQGQRKWMGAMIQACLYLALYRVYDFGPVKLRNLMNEIEQIRAEQGQKEKNILEHCKKETGIDIAYKFGGKIR